MTERDDMSERPTQAEIDKANSSHEQEVLKLAREFFGDPVKYAYSTEYHATAKEIVSFVFKLRAKDAETIASLKAQLAEAQKVPDGWQLVPGDAGEAMLLAADKLNWYDEDVRANYINLWQLMLSAAPTYKKED